MYWAALIMIILHTNYILCCHYNKYLRNTPNIIHDTIRQPPKLSLVLPWSSKGRQWMINLTILHLARANTRQWLNYLIISDLFRHPHHTIQHEWGFDHSHQDDNTWEQLASKYPALLHWWGDLGLDYRCKSPVLLSYCPRGWLFTWSGDNNALQPPESCCRLESIIVNAMFSHFQSSDFKWGRLFTWCGDNNKPMLDSLLGLVGN